MAAFWYVHIDRKTLKSNKGAHFPAPQDVFQAMVLELRGMIAQTNFKFERAPIECIGYDDVSIRIPEEVSEATLKAFMAELDAQLPAASAAYLTAYGSEGQHNASALAYDTGPDDNDLDVLGEVVLP